MQGKFITLEGGEGTGKSTQIKLLSEYLQGKGIEVVTTKEPGGTPLGQEIRRLLVTGEQDKLDAIGEALLFFADRHIHLTKKIWPAMEKGQWVLSDRFADSTFAYQCYGYKNKVSEETLDELYKIAVGAFKPDLTIILDIDPKVGIERSLRKAEGEVVKEIRFEGIDISFHERLRQGYLEIAAKEPKRCVVLDANKSIEALHQEIVNVVKERLGF